MMMMMMMMIIIIMTIEIKSGRLTERGSLLLV